MFNTTNKKFACLADIARDLANYETIQEVKIENRLNKISCVNANKRPTNVWNYNGVRVENIIPENKKSIQKVFSQFGIIQRIEAAKKSTTTVVIYYDNPYSPVDAIGQLQGAIIASLNYDGRPLKMYLTTKIAVNLTSKKPTNIWNYNGIRVENINIENKKLIQKIFSRFGKIQKTETLKKSKSTLFVYYDNPNSPIEACFDLQNATIGSLNFNGKPLRLFFAPTNEQTELRFSRPKYPPDNKGECYYWRTTFCSPKYKCSLLHIPVNKHIDAQVWMVTRDGKQIV